jgi:hypothetical protein
MAESSVRQKLIVLMNSQFFQLLLFELVKKATLKSSRALSPISHSLNLYHPKLMLIQRPEHLGCLSCHLEKASQDFHGQLGTSET